MACRSPTIPNAAIRRTESSTACGQLRDRLVQIVTDTLCHQGLEQRITALGQAPYALGVVPNPLPDDLHEGPDIARPAVDLQETCGAGAVARRNR
jgi:hypothetical protein